MPAPRDRHAAGGRPPLSGELVKELRELADELEDAGEAVKRGAALVRRLVVLLETRRDPLLDGGAE
jgi:hypothetical protein